MTTSWTLGELKKAIATLKTVFALLLAIVFMCDDWQAPSAESMRVWSIQKPRPGAPSFAASAPKRLNKVFTDDLSLKENCPALVDFDVSLRRVFDLVVVDFSAKFVEQ